MKAILHRRYGPPAGLALEEVDLPYVPEGGVLVRVRGSSVNPAEWYTVQGLPWVARPAMGWLRPGSLALGTDFAGVVEAVGPGVTRFKPGEEVMGGRLGAYAEYLAVPEDRAIVPKPSNLSFEQAGSVAIAGATALQALREAGNLQPGQRVLVNGASGGVGTFAVQIAKALGARVTAVCSTRNVEQALSLGADEVVDYQEQRLNPREPRFDLVLQIAGSRSWSEYAGLMTRSGSLVMVGGPHGGPLLGPLAQIIRLRVASIGSPHAARFFVAALTRDTLMTLRELIESGQVTPVVERSYGLGEVPAALEHLGEGHARGKIAISV